MKVTRKIQQTYRDLPVIGSGYSWLRYLFPYVGAAAVKKKWATLIGQGRGAFAYPDFVKDLKVYKKMDPYKCCVACSSCTQIMRDGGSTGCVIQDKEIYGPNYRAVRRLAPDTLKAEAERCRACETPFCQRECPAGLDVPGFIKAYADGDIKKAYKILAQKNAIPEICAYVCPTEVQCQGGCVEGLLTGQPVAIPDIQRAIAEQARKQGLIKLTQGKKRTNKKVAVVGAGASGIACTLNLLRKGHKVTIFDARPKPGGTVRYIIPAARIPYDKTDQELEGLLENAPADLLIKKYNTPLSLDNNLDRIAAAHDVVYLAMGLPESKTLATKPFKNLRGALDFLDEVKSQGSVKVPENVAVIGGGNAGMDTAITAKKNGARNVYMICFESFKTMPAWLSERQNALIEDVHFFTRFMPKEYISDNGNIKAVRMVHVHLADPDEKGFCKPIELPESDIEVKVDMVIEALGQKGPDNLSALLPGVSLTRNNLVAIGEDNHATSRAGVYAGGDLVNGGLTAVQAVADGIQAAAEIDKFLNK
jgi:glutamate synthase (NADPH/NADH) small chain